MMKKLINTAFVYMIAGLTFGLFYREYTQYVGYTGKTTLSILHTHTLMLGMFFFLVVSLFEISLKLTSSTKFKKFYFFYNIGFIATILLMLTRGITDIHIINISKGLNAAISGMAGIAHILITVGLFYFFSILREKARSIQ